MKEMDGNKKISLKYFGTDGFRGEYGKELTDAHAEAIGRFLGAYYGGAEADILIGRDTRQSSPLLEAAIVRGIRSAGGTAYLLGVCPTPAVSYLARHGGASAAVMITASHNPASDNGIKLFGSDGEKLPDEVTAVCEEFIDEKAEFNGKGGRFTKTNANENGEMLAKTDVNKDDERFVKSDANEKCGRFVNVQHGIMLWEKKLTSSVGDLSGLRIGIDCANGATYNTAPRIFKALGAEVFTIGCEPDGENINLGVGSTHPEALAMMVQGEGLDMGFAFDGDGDRCIAIDRSGEIIDGDGEMFILARAMKERGELQDNVVVCTVMSNGGFTRSLEKEGIKCLTTAVGDRFVAERMKESGATLGGEQSGHLIFREGGGDGIYTALRLATEVKKSGKSLWELTEGLTLFPQLSESIRVRDKGAIMADKEISELVKLITEEIGDRGRILLRPSGTENLTRLMVEHENPDKCKQYLYKIAEKIKERGKIVNED